MIRYERSLLAAAGKAREAAAWAQEVTAYLNGKLPQAKIQAFTHRFGDVSTITWQADFDSLASLENYQQAVNADQGYWQLIDQTDELFAEGSIYDTILQSL